MSTTSMSTVASGEWSRRPADERFWAVQELLAAASQQQAESVEVVIPRSRLRVGMEDGELLLLDDGGAAARLTHNAHRQFSGLLGMPADYVAGLPAPLALLNYQHGLLAYAEAGPDEQGAFLVNYGADENAPARLRAATSTRYSRIWNAEVAKKAVELVERWSWRVPPARPSGQASERTRIAAPADCIAEWAQHSLAIRPGDRISPAGIYLTNDSGFSPELFVLLVNPKAAIEGAGGRKLTPFVLLKNSEAAYGRFEVTGGLLDYVCGNHLLWGASLLFDVSVRHVGSATDRAMQALEIALVKYHALLEDPEGTFGATVQAARNYVLPGDGKAEVVEAVAGMLRIPKKVTEQGWTLAEESGAYGAPNTAWGMLNGLTEASQKDRALAERHVIDVAAGKLLQLAAKKLGVVDGLGSGLRLVREAQKQALGVGAGQ